VSTNFEIKAPRPLSQATASNHSKAFAFTLTLTGRTSGRSLGTFSQTMLFLPPHNKVSLTSPQDFLTFTATVWQCFLCDLCQHIISRTISGRSAVEYSKLEWAGCERVRRLLQFGLFEPLLLEASSWGTRIVREPRVRKTCAFVSRYQTTTAEHTADWKDLVHAAVNFIVCELAAALYLLVVSVLWGTNKSDYQFNPRL
jgi:hypothetical protein